MASKNQVSPEGLAEESSVKKPSLLFSVRALISFIMFLGYTVNYLQRTNMSIAIVCMINSTAVLELEGSDPVINNSSENSKCSLLSSNSFEGKFAWSRADQGLILAAYFYGYLITQIPGGWLAGRFGGRIVIIVSMFIPSILSLVTPPLANLNTPALVIVVRFFIGLFHGLMFPAIAFVFSQWAPDKEKSRLVGLSQAGMHVGNVISSIVGGILCENGFYDGWGSIFILFGAFGFIWLAMFLFLATDSPANHRFISKTELNYLTVNIHTGSPLKKKQNFPWKGIFTSKACLSTFLANFSSNWGGYLFLTQTPTYMKDVLKFDIKSNGLYSSFPFIAGSIMVFVSSFISDLLISHHLLSIKNVRKLFTGLGMFVPMLISVALTFVDCSEPFWAVALLTIGVGMIGCVGGGGFIVNINDLGGKHYSGLLYGISNTFGTIPGIIAPYFVGLVTPNGSFQEWKIVFFVTTGIYVVGTFPYIFLAQGKVEKWALVEEDLDSKIEKDVERIEENKL